jgi:GT2 family glycosyltransferase
MRKPAITVIVPVYGDWDSLEQNIRSLLKTVPVMSGHKVLFVNDCGPEADTIEDNIIELINGYENFSYHRNNRNLGFVKNCNNAVLNLSDKSTDILLLNSDTKVTKGFLTSMQNVLYAKHDIGAVCPRSNAATIFSVPMNTSSHTTYTMEQSYALYKKIKWRLPKYYISPIAHGFCMMIRRSVVNQYGLFDEIYGKGYGEENDFCMRIRNRGWKCAVANKAFVFHYKARSFGDKQRTTLVRNNEDVLINRYPEYRTLIHEYVEKTVRPFERRLAVR